MPISRHLYEMVKLSRRPQYILAHRAGLHPSTLSKIMHGIESVKRGDPRVLKLGHLLGIPQEKLFDEKNNTEFREKSKDGNPSRR